MHLIHISKPLDETHINKALIICDNELGKGYLTHNDLKKIIHNKNILVIGVFDHENKMLGFGYCSILKQIQFKKSLNPSQYKKIPDILKTTQKIGITNTMVILNNYKNLGLGTSIFNNFLTFFKENSIELITGFAWKTKEGVNMEAIFKKNNFYVLKTIQQYWHEDSLENQYDCPECGTPPCNCSTVIYFKKSI